jgi:uncharacterized protein DUF4412
MRVKQAVAAAALLLFASAAFAGVSYRFESVTSGLGEQRISGVVESEGARMRMNISRGDGATFPDHSYALTSPDGRRILVFDPAAKTYYEMFLDSLIAEGSKLPSLLGGVFDSIATTNAKYYVRDGGNGGTIAGYPTRHTTTTSSYDLRITVVDHKMTVHVATTTDIWTTDKLPASLANFLQSRSVRTGVASIDKLLIADPRAPKGFPLKQVTTMRVVQNGAPIVVTSTYNVSGIATKQFPASEFAMPAGYRRVDSPIERAMKALK